jgi:hypothetical protein
MMVPGISFVSLGPTKVKKMVAPPTATARQSQRAGAASISHQWLPGAPSNLGIWLPRMMSPTPDI